MSTMNEEVPLSLHTLLWREKGSHRALGRKLLRKQTLSCCAYNIKSTGLSFLRKYAVIGFLVGSLKIPR